MSNKAGLLVCIASPSGGGKTTVCRKLIERHGDYRFSVSGTTRDPRDGEQDGVDYYFLSEEEFNKKVNNGEFAEYERVHGQMYGTLYAAVQEALDNGEVLLNDIDVKGASTLKSEYGDQCLTIFLQPPSMRTLKERLISRGTETEESFKRRMHRISLEIEYGKQFDVEIVNDQLMTTVDEAEQSIENRRSAIMEEAINGS
ncbi:MAG: guanylate kinase [Candidatus Marinimicrobia bacterium]|nr:guanylate kinase [Candidatus Neomarinimicrobiota bacterium]MCF7829688.1 guanylate kinase [Candidatus Neomarinimicrobiota bacterium]MCF7881638.1 guanylate kinase [Candidatus Neomarinimicrobiota bacterium]